MGLVAYGRAEVRVNGELRRTKKNVIARGIGGFTREAIIEDTYHGHKEEAVAAECEFSETAFDNVSLTDLANLTDATITFESAGTDKTFVMRNAVCQGGIELTSGDSESKVIFFGPSWEEQN